MTAFAKLTYPSPCLFLLFVPRVCRVLLSTLRAAEAATIKDCEPQGEGREYGQTASALRQPIRRPFWRPTARGSFSSVCFFPGVSSSSPVASICGLQRCTRATRYDVNDAAAHAKGPDQNKHMAVCVGYDAVLHHGHSSWSHRPTLCYNISLFFIYVRPCWLGCIHRTRPVIPWRP